MACRRLFDLLRRPSSTKNTYPQICYPRAQQTKRRTVAYIPGVFEDLLGTLLLWVNPLALASLKSLWVIPSRWRSALSSLDLELTVLQLVLVRDAGVCCGAGLPRLVEIEATIHLGCAILDALTVHQLTKLVGRRDLRVLLARLVEQLDRAVELLELGFDDARRHACIPKPRSRVEEARGSQTFVCAVSDDKQARRASGEIESELLEIGALSVLVWVQIYHPTSEFERIARRESEQERMHIGPGGSRVRSTSLSLFGMSEKAAAHENAITRRYLIWTLRGPGPGPGAISPPFTHTHLDGVCI